MLRGKALCLFFFSPKADADLPNSKEGSFCFQRLENMTFSRNNRYATIAASSARCGNGRDAKCNRLAGEIGRSLCYSGKADHNPLSAHRNIYGIFHTSRSSKKKENNCLTQESFIR